MTATDKIGSDDIPSRVALRDRLEQRLKTHPIEGNPAVMRARFLQLVGQGPAGTPCEFGGVACMQHGTGRPIIWLHGGGYVFGSPHTHARAAHRLAHLAKASVIVPAYRLAPEHTWPAALEDALAVLDAVPDPVTLIGDSAGGHLALAAARRRPSQVKALAVISPNTDRTGQSETRRRNTLLDLMNSDADDAMLAKLAMPDIAPDHPDASPILADLSYLPPTFVTAATHEVLLDDALLLLRALGQAAIPVEAHILPELFHMWHLWPGDLDEADDTLAKIASFSARMA